jgi:hypothetical protein
MSTGQWYTLVRFRADPQHLTGVSQARTAQEALTQFSAWEQAFPDDTIVVFDRENRPLTSTQLEALARGSC